MKLMVSLLSSLHLPAEDLWLRDLYRGEVDIFITHLLSQTLKLRRLCLDSDFQRGTCFILKKVCHVPEDPF